MLAILAILFSTSTADFLTINMEPGFGGVLLRSSSQIVQNLEEAYAHCGESAQKNTITFM